MINVSKSSLTKNLIETKESTVKKIKIWQKKSKTISNQQTSGRTTYDENKWCRMEFTVHLRSIEQSDLSLRGCSVVGHKVCVTEPVDTYLIWFIICDDPDPKILVLTRLLYRTWVELTSSIFRSLHRDYCPSFLELTHFRLYLVVSSTRRLWTNPG